MRGLLVREREKREAEGERGRKNYQPWPKGASRFSSQHALYLRRTRDLGLEYAPTVWNCAGTCAGLQVYGRCGYAYALCAEVSYKVFDSSQMAGTETADAARVVISGSGNGTGRCEIGQGISQPSQHRDRVSVLRLRILVSPAPRAHG